MTEADHDPLTRLFELAKQALDHRAGLAVLPGHDITDIEIAINLERAAERHLLNSVTEARTRGVSWQDIGDTFGVSRQAVFKRFGSTETTSEQGTQMTKPVVNLAERTEEVFRMLSQDDYAGVKALMTFSCSRVLTKKKVMAVWNQVIAATGPFESCSDTVTQTADGRNLALQQINQLLSGGLVGQTMLNHEAGEWLGRVAYNSSGKITGILIVSPLEKHNLPF